ncbi:hypothetical protein J4439_04205, partial [Candidatus Woesearchaeota archaeon]|nr:hypothetical protein [Candidatus Woesearchaeota archaeon]
MFFSLDAIMALMIITVGMLFIANSYVSERPSSRQIYASTDIVGVLGELRVSEVNNSFVQGLIAGGTIQGSSVNNTLLEQAAQFWSENQTTLATDLLRNVTLQLFPEFTDYSILVGGDELLAVQTSQKVLIIPMKRLVSGIARDKPVHGIAARVFLGAVAGKETSQFIYFGGFAGQGNVTVYLDTIPSDANITGLEIEVAAGSAFDFYANNGSCGTLTPSVGNLTADRWDVTACAGSLIPGSGVKNNFTLEFLGGINDSFVGGGFVKVTYETDSLVEGVPNGIARYRFPAIQGLVNLYDGLVVPGTIVNMSGYLHYYVYNSSALGTSAILLIGSTTVYNVTNASADESIILTNATLGALLNYTQLSNGTVPLRFLIGNLSFGIVTLVMNGTVHAALVTDVSGSMDWEMGSGSTGVRRNCTDANLGNSDTQRLSVAKCVDQEFVQLIFANGSMDSAIGLVSYDTATDNTLNLTNNVSLLNASIAAYTDLSSTCISCGVYNATVMLRKSFTQLNNATWRYSADYQSSSPPAGWQDLSFDDSSWGDGPAPLGFGNVVTTVINTSLYPQLWELWQDAPLPVDFTTGLNSTANTYGLVTSASKPLKNSNFSGPSINNWTQTGIVNLSSGGAVVKFSEDFETNTLGKWTEFGDLDWSVDTSPAYGSYSGHADDSDNPSYLNVTLNATSSINLSGETDCNLSYWWNMDSLDGGEYFTLDIFDGAWNNNVSFRSDAWDDNTWRQQRIDLDAAYGMVSDFLLRFVFKASATNDDLWLDNINITCVQAGLGSFGLTDYWYVDSAGSLKQNFSRGNGTLQSATLSFAHGTDDSLFDGTAGVFCNLTHPSGTVNVWSASWTSATNPAGAVTEVVNLTSYLNSSGFNYTLECGAAVTSGGGRTIVAFDDIVVTLNYSGNDGWDWKEGVYGNTSNEDVRFGDPSGLSNYTSTGRIEVSLGGQGNTLLQESGSWGLQFYVSQAMVDNVSSGA